MDGGIDEAELPPNVCRDFLRMVCNRGHMCRYAHPPNFPVNQAKNWNIHEARHSFCKSLCHDYQNGKCTKEDCKYVHCNAAEEANFASTGSLPEQLFEEAIIKGIVPFLPGSIPVCKDYLNGACRRGRACRFRHMTKDKYRNEIDSLFGFTPQSADEPQAKMLKYSTSNPGFIENSASYFNQRSYDNEMNAVRIENEMLKKQVDQLKQKVSGLETANEYLLEQNASLRTRKNARILTIQPPTPTTLNVHQAPGQQIVASAVPVSMAPVSGPGAMAISTMASAQQLVPVSCNATGQQIMAAVSTVTVAGQTGSPALLATAVPVSSTGSQLVPVSAVPVSLATVSMAPMHIPPIATAANAPTAHNLAMSATAATSLVSYPIMTQQITANTLM